LKETVEKRTQTLDFLAHLQRTSGSSTNPIIPRFRIYSCCAKQKRGKKVSKYNIPQDDWS
jgi:hypothetical protein